MRFPFHLRITSIYLLTEKCLKSWFYIVYPLPPVSPLYVANPVIVTIHQSASGRPKYSGMILSLSVTPSLIVSKWMFDPLHVGTKDKWAEIDEGWRKSQKHYGSYSQNSSTDKISWSRSKHLQLIPSLIEKIPAAMEMKSSTILTNVSVCVWVESSQCCYRSRSGWSWKSLVKETRFVIHIPLRKIWWKNDNELAYYLTDS